MARLVAVVLLLTLAVAPAVSAEPRDRGESPFAGWFDAIWDALERVFSRVPIFRLEPREHGAMVVPNGLQAAPRRSGAMIVPNGVRSGPNSLEGRRLRNRAAVMKR